MKSTKQIGYSESELLQDDFLFYFLDLINQMQILVFKKTTKVKTHLLKNFIFLLIFILNDGTHNLKT